MALIDKTMLLPIAMPSSESDEKENVEKKMKELKNMIYNFKMQRWVN